MDLLHQKKKYHPICEKYIFNDLLSADGHIMRQRASRFTAWLLLVAFSVMITGRAYHHHARVIHEDFVCPLEGVLLSEHMNHHSVISEYEGFNDEGCLICHFQIVKAHIVVASPTGIFQPAKTLAYSWCLGKSLQPYVFQPFGRAPPIIC